MAEETLASLEPEWGVIGAAGKASVRSRGDGKERCVASVVGPRGDQGRGKLDVTLTLLTRACVFAAPSLKNAALLGPG